MGFNMRNDTDMGPSLYENRESADLTLVCASQTFKIHSLILCPRSSFFRAAFEGGFKVDLVT